MMAVLFSQGEYLDIGNTYTTWKLGYYEGGLIIEVVLTSAQM